MRETLTDGEYDIVSMPWKYDGRRPTPLERLEAWRDKKRVERWLARR